MKINKNTPTKHAAELLEYMLSVGNMSYLRPRSLDMSLIELYTLDIVVVLGVVLSIFLAIGCIWMVKIVINASLRFNSKTKRE